MLGAWVISGNRKGWGEGRPPKAGSEPEQRDGERLKEKRLMGLGNLGVWDRRGKARE